MTINRITFRHVFPLLLAAVIVTGCAGVGGTRSGKKFNYDKVTEIKKGETTKEQVAVLLEAEPTNKGRFNDRDVWTYQYQEGGAASFWSFIPYLGASLGGTKVTDYTATVRFKDDGVVESVEYNKLDSGSQSAGI